MTATVANLTTMSSGIRELYSQTYIDAVYRNHELFPLLGLTPKPHLGGHYLHWVINSAGSTPGVFSEGDSAIDSSNQTYIQPYVSPVYIWNFLRISGHLKDAMVNGGYFDVIGDQIEKAIADIADLFTTSFLGSTYGLEVAIDSGSTYAGITRGSQTAFEAQETAVSGALSFASVRDMVEGLRDNDVGSKLGPQNGLILMPHNQASNFYDLAGSKGIPMLSPNDPAQGFSSQSYDGIPIKGIGDLTDTVMLFIDKSFGNYELVQFRGMDVKAHSNTGDDELIEISGALAFACKNPKVQGKLTGLSS